MKVGVTYLFLFCSVLFLVKSVICRKEKDVVDIDEVKQLKNHPSVFFIDVREPSEICETGLIPGSFNIPLETLRYALDEMPEEEFKLRYGRKKPNFETPLVFTCRTGRRSKKAMDMALSLGYRNVRHYSGGWQEWEKDLVLENISSLKE